MNLPPVISTLPRASAHQTNESALINQTLISTQNSSQSQSLPSSHSSTSSVTLPLVANCSESPLSHSSSPFFHHPNFVYPPPQYLLPSSTQMNLPMQMQMIFPPGAQYINHYMLQTPGMEVASRYSFTPPGSLIHPVAGFQPANMSRQGGMPGQAHFTQFHPYSALHQNGQLNMQNATTDKSAPSPSLSAASASNASASSVSSVHSGNSAPLTLVSSAPIQSQFLPGGLMNLPANPALMHVNHMNHSNGVTPAHTHSINLPPHGLTVQAFPPMSEAIHPVVSPSALNSRPQVATAHQSKVTMSRSSSSFPVAAQVSGSGTSCHQCKTSRPSSLLFFCTRIFTDSTGKSKQCRKKYCKFCAFRLYWNEFPEPIKREMERQKDEWNEKMTQAASGGADEGGNSPPAETPEALEALQTFICPSCRNTCACAACTRKIIQSRKNAMINAAQTAVNKSSQSKSQGQFYNSTNMKSSSSQSSAVKIEMQNHSKSASDEETETTSVTESSSPPSSPEHTQSNAEALIKAATAADQAILQQENETSINAAESLKRSREQSTSEDQSTTIPQPDEEFSKRVKTASITLQVSHT
jgi:hypothetical protein